MKILYLGNDSNVSFNFASIFNRNGVASELLQIEDHITHHPLWEIVDTDIEELPSGPGYEFYPKSWINDQHDRTPSWVRTVQTSNNEGIATELTDPRFQASMVLRLRRCDCDIIHAEGLWPAIWASFSGKPYLYRSVGINDWRDYEQTNSSIKRPVYATLGKRAIRQAAIVVSTRTIVSGIEDAFDVRTASMPVMIDLERFRPSEDSIEDDLKQKYDANLVFFAGARHDWEINANNVIFEGLADSSLSDFHVLTPEWGSDVGRTKELISNLGIADDVSFLPLLSRARLRRYLSSVDAVFDAFAHDGIGSLARQALACGTPLFEKYDPSNHLESYGFEHPVLQAETPAEIASQVEAIRDRAERERIGTRSREFMEEHYGWSSLGRSYLKLYEDVITA